MATEGIGAVRDDDIMYELAGQDAEDVLLAAYEPDGNLTLEALRTGGSAYDAKKLIKELVRLGLAHTRADDGTLGLTGRGRKIASKIVASLAQGWRRDDQTRRWVLEAALAGRRFSANDLAEQWGADRSRSREEIIRAITVLEQHDMIEAISTSAGAVVADITQQGRDALERSIIVRPAGMPSMVVTDRSDHSRTINQSGGAIGAVQMGDQSTQHNTVTLDGDLTEVREVLQRALERVDELPDQVAAAVREAINEAITETQAPNPRRGFLRQLLEKVLVASAPSAVTSAGRWLLNAIGSLLS